MEHIVQSIRYSCFEEAHYTTRRHGATVSELNGRLPILIFGFLVDRHFKARLCSIFWSKGLQLNSGY
jgi:hypothetical protein